MKYRRGLFAVYRGKEYELGVGKEHELTLYSEDPIDLQIGFKQIDENTFSLEVKKEDLSSYYSVGTLALYKGFEFGIRTVDGEKILISSSGENWTRKFIEELGLEQVDLRVYEKWVDEKDLEKVWEKKSSIRLL
ncbi:MAG: hypothetical protein IPI26_08275 [Elusimicrobia bacterium]|jgi:hypothetical protein|nr:hypothetical protein [Elusimicrobiota bacterium]MBK7545575.1 hypothetical protein [Elusimicrobiota bacterium]MBK7575234.1 hypothetical protein [Elusimicrobiota bacterium]MBL0249916.1 hypothetical protein [Elusimicrobiota bacterium]